MLWGVTLRSPHPYARIRGIDITEALATAGVFAVLTHDDVPGLEVYGLELRPAGAGDRRRALPGRAGRAGRRRPPRDRPAGREEDRRRLRGHWSRSSTPLHGACDAGQRRGCTREGNLVRHLKIRSGDPDADRPTSSVVGDYEVGMQDQAFLGPESGLAVPDGDGGVDLYVATQWLHVDQRQICSALGLGPDQVRLRSPASAARSAAARTCRCTCTAACSRCTPASR